MMSILGRMNPGVCLGGRYDDVVTDGAPEETSNDSTQKGSGGDSELDSQKGGSGSAFTRCHPHCYSKYEPDDKVEPLPSDVVLQSLSRTVPGLLACISSSPPTKFADGTSQYNRRKAVRECIAKRTEALQKLYDLTKKGNEHNRVPLCNEQNWDNVVGVLSTALLASIEEDSEKNTIEGGTKNQSKNKQSVDDDRRLICWTLNNLSIPYENKLAIALGAHSANLFQAITMVIQANLPESYLCCICLLNITFLADAIRPVTFYVPSSYGNGKPPYSPLRSRSSSSQNNSSGSGRPPASPLSRAWSLRLRNRSANEKNLCEGRISEICGLVLGNSSSLIRVVERMMVTNAPFLLSSAQSVQGEAIRWSCGFIRNVTYAGQANDTDDGNQGSDSLSGSIGRQGVIPNESIEEICLLISQTEIPRLMVQFVKDSPHKTIKWTRDSLEDICLGAMCNLAQWQSSQEALKRAGAVQCLEKIESLPGIHGYRARAIMCSLGALPMQFG
ncbi:hypothetical protein ACHAXR_003064 [Thalassiosira sp. AJA248-18]